MIDTKYEWNFYWWRVDRYRPWEPVAVRTNNHGEEIVSFLGSGTFSFKEKMGGQFGPEIVFKLGESNERKSN